MLYTIVLLAVTTKAKLILNEVIQKDILWVIFLPKGGKLFKL